MRIIVILLLAVAVYSCADRATTKETTKDTVVKTTAADDLSDKSVELNPAWIKEFREFRDAVYKNDLAKIKTYFSFPIVSPYNHIWDIALEGSGVNFPGFTQDTIIAFTEKDFDKYYRKILSKEFVNSLLKIKSEDLFTHNDANTDIFETDSTEQSDGALRYQLFASVDKKTNILRLNLAFTGEIKDDSGEMVDGIESNVVYDFLIQPDGHLVFQSIQLAG